MNLSQSKKISGCAAIFWLLLISFWLANSRLSAASPEPAAPTYFNVTTYKVADSPLMNDFSQLFSPYTGPRVTVEDMVKAAAELHLEFCRHGYPQMSVAIAPDRIANGVVTLNVFPTVIPQVVISGECYLRFTNNPATVPSTPAEMAEVRTALYQQMADLEAERKLAELKAHDGRVHVVSTNAGPKFAVDKYRVMGNSILSPQAMAQAFTNIDGAFGTNVSLDGIRTAVSELQKAYRERGYVTVAVGLPQQKITNATVKVQVTEGRLATIKVTGNHYFSSNNVMRALPSLHTNTILNGLIFQAELNRANANQDRQIYPVIGPGPEPGTSELALKVKDQLPVHGKVDFNNENSPGTPDFRVNASAVAGNLWQLEHSFGFQYGFSPQQYKLGNQWSFYDQPLIANYSGFYRLPLGNPKPIESIIADNPSSFGYNEATRKFNLPPPSGRPELNFYASRSTSDTGLITPVNEVLPGLPGFVQITRRDDQEDITVNGDVGTRLSIPVNTSSDFQSGFSGGLDYKTYGINSVKTNNFIFSITTFDQHGNPNHISSTVVSPVPVTDSSLEYLPLALSYNGTWRNPHATVGFGLGVSGNPWYSSETSTNGHIQSTGEKSFQGITDSAKSTGYWVTLNPSLSIDVPLPEQWLFSVHANGQWTSEPLISTEQFGIGGVNSVRGYHEGEIFGDNGWRCSIEQQTPPHVVGMINGKEPLTVRGSIYMDYATAYLLDPHGRPGHFELWSTGVGFIASVGSHWQSRFLFSLPLISTSTTPYYQPYFNFGLTAQF